MISFDFLGNASQSLKMLRERDYLSKTDSEFQSFVAQRRAGMNDADLEDERLSHMDEKKFVKTAKQYG